jgi:hypothetical protein
MPNQAPEKGPLWGRSCHKNPNQISWNLTISDGCFSRQNGHKETMLFITVRQHHQVS